MNKEYKCKDCIHYCVCKDTATEDNWTDETPIEIREIFSPKHCEYFFPSADLVPVRHGEWIQTKEPLGWKDIDCVMCSACEDKWIMDEEYDLDFYKEQWIYCPNCGAMMDGGNK